MQQPRKIVFDASPLLVNKTGVAYYIERLITHFAKQYPDVELVGFYYNFLGRRSTDHLPIAPNIRYRPVRFLPSKIIYQLRRWGFEIPLELLTKERADFVLFGNFWGYPSIYHTPAAPVVHDLAYLDLPDYVTAKNRSDLTRLVPQQIKRSRFVVTVSEFTKHKIAKQYHIDPSAVVITPIPPSTTTPLAPERQAELRAKLGLTKPYILFVGTVEPRKNITGLIDGYEQLPQAQRDKYSLVLVGRTGWHCESELARIAAAQKAGLDVIHLGYISDEERTAVYQSATIFSSASHYEGFGIPVLEAMSYGLPCAVSDIEVFHEVAADTARYFDQNDPSSIAATLGKLLGDEQTLRQLSAAARHRALHDFTWEAVATLLYERICTELTRK